VRWRDETNPRPVPASPGRRNPHLILWISSLLFRFLLGYHARQVRRVQVCCNRNGLEALSPSRCPSSFDQLWPLIVRRRRRHVWRRGSASSVLYHAEGQHSAGHVICDLTLSTNNVTLFWSHRAPLPLYTLVRLYI
jgi:hypothetical protein